MLYRGARILILDEPTAVLAPQEVDELIKTLRSMTEAGRSIVFISHKLAEVLAVADRITVMRARQGHGGRHPRGGHHQGATSPAGWWAGRSSSGSDRAPVRSPGRSSCPCKGSTRKAIAGCRP